MTIKDYYWSPVLTIQSVGKIGNLKFRTYLRVFNFLQVEDSLRTSSFVAFSYQWLPLETTLFVIIRYLKFETYFEVLYSLWMQDSLQALKSPLHQRNHPVGI